MEVLQSKLAEMYVLALAGGFVSCLIYTMVSVMICRGYVILRHIWDFLFAVICGITMILIQFYGNYGQIRLGVVFVWVLGCLAFYVPFARIVKKTLLRLRMKLDRLFKLIVKPITVPIGYAVTRIRVIIATNKKRRIERRAEKHSSPDYETNTEDENAEKEHKPRLHW